jgi:pimeloyl-ACP methyl ester carboxylesterase
LSSDESVRALIDRYDASVLPPPGGDSRVRLRERDGEAWDVVLSRKGDRPRLEKGNGDRPDATITADAATWSEIARDARAGLEGFRRGRLRVRGNMHLVVGLLAATSGDRTPGRLRMRNVSTREGTISVSEAGTGPPVLLIHGLGGSKVSFLTTVAALAPHHRAIAFDLPGFGDSDKPVGVPYDPAWFAKVSLALMDAMGIERPHLVGNSLGGRIALEVGFRAPDRIGRLALLAPSLAWLRERRWANPLRLLRPELGLLQPAPRPIVEAIVRRMVPGSDHGWTAAGVDEFLRAYLTPRGRAAFYAAARNIYLEDPDTFWPRLERLEPRSLFVWGLKDPLVPHAFMRHVERALPAAEHIELDCGHVPQLEAPGRTHSAVLEFFGDQPEQKQKRRVT